MKAAANVLSVFFQVVAQNLRLHFVRTFSTVRFRVVGIPLYPLSICRFRMNRILSLLATGSTLVFRPLASVSG